jgi:hypothetical protein
VGPGLDGSLGPTVRRSGYLSGMAAEGTGDTNSANGADRVERNPWDRELTEEELAIAAQRWPDKSLKRQIRNYQLKLRSEYFHQQDAGDGTGRRRFGGVQPGAGRKSKRKLGEAVLEYAEETATQKRVRDAFDAGLTAKDDPALRVKTAVALTKAVQGEEALTMRREEIARDLDKTPLEEVKRIAAEGILRSIQRGDITQDDLSRIFGIKQQRPAIEGTAEDVAV